MKMNLTLGVNKHNVAWHVCDQIKVPSGGRALHRRSVPHKVDRPMRVLGYRTPAEPFADEPPDLQA